MDVTEPALGLLDRLSPELRLEIFEYVLTTPERLCRPQEAQESDNFTSLLLTNKRLYNESIDLLYRNNSFWIESDEVAACPNIVNFSNIRELEIWDSDACCKVQSKLDLIWSVLSAVNENHTSIGCDQPRLETLTIWTESLSWDQLIGLKAQCSQLDGVKIVDQDVGQWIIQIGETFEVTLVHLQLHEAWLRLQSDPTVSLQTVTEQICCQAVGQIPNVHELTEAYLLRAALALHLWFDVESDSSKSDEYTWIENSAVSFVAEYAMRAKAQLGEVAPGAADILRLDDQELAIPYLNSVLLQLVSPFAGFSC